MMNSLLVCDLKYSEFAQKGLIPLIFFAEAEAKS